MTSSLKGRRGHGMSDRYPRKPARGEAILRNDEAAMQHIKYTANFNNLQLCNLINL
jgi:hypothetical protein